MNNKNELLNNIDKLHTTELGIERVKRNLSLDTDDIVEFIKRKISDKNAHINRKGKNYYIEIENNIITVNASNFTIITAHTIKK